MSQGHHIELTDDGTNVTVTAGQARLATYTYRSGHPQVQSPRPYLHPVHTLTGQPVTDYMPEDHIWHQGFSWSLPHVGPHNLWGGPTYIRDQGYEWLDNDGSMEHDSFDSLSSGAVASIRERLTWRAAPAEDPAPGSGIGAALASEQRESVITTMPEQDAWLFSFTSSATNITDVALPLGSPTTHGRDNAGYGGLFWRGPRSFTGATLLAPGQAGGDELRGRRYPWMGFCGPQPNGASSTIVIADLPGNPGGHPQWFARSEEFAALCAAPFFSTEVAFDPGETVTFRYAVAIADGATDPNRGQALATAATEWAESLT